MRSAYAALKHNAKRRHKQFTISFECFKQFCFETNYMAGKGRTKKSYSVDRIKEELGYVEGNLQVLTVSDNSRKRHKVLNYDWESGQAIVVDSNFTPPPVSDDNPF
jgi:hypothetical protein